ncbi:MAG: multi-sensor signal transduction histidine kinase [Bacilli bacterium]|nr:multi-sensor signal transduction histidine kinase [Bacilli bacterium]
MGIFKRYWQDRSIRFKLNTMLFLIILITIFTLSFWGSKKYSDFSETQADQYTLQMIHQVESNVDFYINHLQDVLYYVGRDPVIDRFLLSSEKELSNQTQAAQVNAVLRTYTERNPEIAGMMLVSQNDQFLGFEMHRISRDPLTNEQWYRHAVDEPGKVALLSNPIGRNIATNQNYSSNDVLSLVSAVNDPSTGKIIGVLLIDLRLDMIKKIFDNIHLGQSGFIYILDNRGNIVYSPVNTIVYRLDNDWLHNVGQGSLTHEINGHDYRILYKDDAANNWRIIGVIPNDDYLRVVSDIQYYTYIIAIVTLLLATLTSSYFTGTIIRPVRKLMRLMKRVQQGDLNQHFTTQTNDEIGQLGNSFNHMVEEIKNLINLVYVEQRKKREAELQVLQAQIKPHFLYNTLDTIQWMAQDNNSEEIIQIIGALTNLFRIGLSKGHEWIPIRDEIKHVESYLIIQMTRYTGKLDYEFDIPEALHRFHVLKLILQPIVENAIYHGIKERTGKGKIQISAEQIHDIIRFRIVDDGIGIPPDKLIEINAILQDGNKRREFEGFGLFNVNERIRLTYGHVYGIKVISEWGKGTTVIVDHPLIQSTQRFEEVNDHVEIDDR